MRALLLKSVVAILVVTTVVIIGLWAVLAAPFTSSMRASVVASALTEQLGQPIVIDGDVRMHLRPVTRVVATGVHIPSENLADVDLAKLDVLEFDINLLELRTRRVDINNILIRGLEVLLLLEEDGATSWSERENAHLYETRSTLPTQTDQNTQATSANSRQEGNGILAFLSTRRANFENIRLLIENEQTGFDFDFALERYVLAQDKDTNTLEVTSRGTVNGLPFSIDGVYPIGAPFTTTASFSSIDLTYNGQPLPDGSGYAAALTVDLESFSDFLEVARLKGSFDGSGTLNMHVTHANGRIALDDIDTQLAFSDGRSMSLTGSVADLQSLNELDLDFAFSFYPPAERPDPARILKDLKLTEISTNISTINGALELVDLLVKTNGFDETLDELGPISIARILRTDDGLLSLSGISIQAGPDDAPYLNARGHIDDALSLRQLQFEGEASLPATVLLTTLEAETAENFGRVVAEFEVDDTPGHLRLSKLTAQAVDTDVWSFDANLQLGDVQDLDDIDINLDLAILDSASFLETLRLDPVDAGRFKLGATLQKTGARATGTFDLDTGKSEAVANFAVDNTGSRRNITAKITSDKLEIADIKKSSDVLAELKKLRALDTELVSETSDDIPLQPLVLPEEQPDAKDLIIPEDLLHSTDVTARLEFNHISGVQGVTNLSSDLTLKDGQAQLGPLDLSYGPGSFRFEAGMDLNKDPHLLNVNGSTRGWDLGDLLTEAGLNLDADGSLNGSFNLAGNITSATMFVNSMVGSARIDMSSGQIGTSLLELAGLGVFPWLFSQERRQGYTDVTCVAAPVSIRAGKISFDRVVAETRAVQLVARGNLDWQADTIAVHAQPRRVGKPLSRSAWPFDVTGRLSQPDFKLQVGGSRSRRADGADQMPANRKPCVPDIYQLE